MIEATMPLPVLIQGGMGVAISDWRPARVDQYVRKGGEAADTVGRC